MRVANLSLPMLLRTLAFLLSLAAVSLHAQGNLLGFNWHLRHGDNSAWVSVPIDAAWSPINLGISWERQNHNNGDAWLRTEVLVPASLEPAGLTLELTLPAQTVEVFLNGRRVAETGGASERLTFDLPSTTIRWGETNQLALRVLGHPWTGGRAQDVVRLVPRGSAPGFDLQTRLASRDHVFAAEAEVAFEFSAPSPAPTAEPVVLHTTVVSDFHQLVHDTTRSVAAVDARRPQSWSLGRFAPGFYQVVVQTSQGPWQAQRVFWFAVDPTKLACAPHPEADADDYWARAQAELAAIPPRFRMQRDAAKSTARHEVYTAEMDSVEGVTLRAWYVVPTRPASGPRPAVLNVPGYSAAMQPEWFQQDDELIQLALDIRGHGRSADVIHPGFGTPGFVGYRVTEPDHYVYRGAYLDCLRAVEFLLSRPEVDPRRIAVSGGSQGGGLALATAALATDHIARCVAGVPFLGDYDHHQAIRDVYRTEMLAYLPPGDADAPRRLRRSTNLIDTLNLADRIKCPVLMGNGLFDDDCPPHIGFAVFNRLATRKEYRIYPDEAHLLGDAWSRDARAWLRREFGLPPLEP